MTRENTTRMNARTRGFLIPVAIALVAIFGAVGESGAQDAAVQLDAVSATVTGTLTIPNPCSGSACVASFTITDLIVHNLSHPAVVLGVALNNTFTSGYSVAGVTWYNGSLTDTLTRVQGSDNTAGTRRVEQWDIVGPNASGSSAGTVTITISGPQGASVDYVAGAISLWNVSSRGPNGCNTPTTGNENNTPAVSLSTTYYREGVVDFLGVPGDFTTVSPDSAQTSRWSGCTGSCGGSQLRGGGSTRPGDHISFGGNFYTNMGWTLNTSTSWVLCAVDYRPYQPTLAHMREYSAFSTERGTLIRWKTSYEVDNLGFRLFREAADGSKVQVTPSLIAGSALFAGQGTALRGGRSYQWLDTSSTGVAPSRYWLEDVSLDGFMTMRGPILPERGPLVASAMSREPSVTRNSTLLKAVGATSATTAAQAPATIRRVVRSANSNLAAQWQLAGMKAARIGVRQDGWYRVDKADLLAAGFDPGTDPSAIRLFTGGVEQAISVVPGTTGSFDASSYIEFYGSGLDTAATDTRIYWLVQDATSRAARRITLAESLGGQPGATSYRAAVERRDRTVYFAALMDPTRDNYFGPTITTEAATQALSLDWISPDQTPAPTLDVAVQGATTSDHRVAVSLNGHSLGEVDFSGIAYKTATLAVDPSYLNAGSNTVSLVALGGSTDVSLVDYVRLDFQRSLYSNADTVDFVGAPLQAVTVKGFTTPHVRVIDVSRPDAVVELPGKVSNLADGFAITATPVPVYQGLGLRPPIAQNMLFAFTEEQAKKPTSIEAHSPSQWHAASNRADLVILTHHDFEDAANKLAQHRAAQGLATQVIDVQEAYDEFSYGAKDPQAIRDLLARAATSWAQAPRFVLLVGDATSDPRNYLGSAMTDFVPTKMVPLEVLKSASDDWFVDFNDTGYPQMAIGRIPVQTTATAAAVVGKLIQYDATPAGAGWTKSATFVSDANDPNLRVAFVDETRKMEQQVPATLAQNEILLGTMDPTAGRGALLSALNSGSLLVTYVGHGTDESWTTHSLFNTTDAAALSNGEKLPVVSALNCLNALFEDPSNDSLGEAFLKAPAGGAVAVLASSALTDPEPQLILGANFYNALFGSVSMPIGQALVAAKTSDVRESVRQSFVLLGDPSMMLRP